MDLATSASMPYPWRSSWSIVWLSCCTSLILLLAGFHELSAVPCCNYVLAGVNMLKDSAHKEELQGPHLPQSGAAANRSGMAQEPGTGGQPACCVWTFQIRPPKSAVVVNTPHLSMLWSALFLFLAEYIEM